ncbi:MAG: hypothetical protein R3264_04150 [Anaerolineae bacterium]|nr:hypothetical protein [Anaerolineae bacterium]
MIDLQELDRARERWQLGHHLFFAYVQSLIIICSELQAQVKAGEVEAARETIERATYVLWGVSVTFKLTGGFSQAAYDGYVRPNMFEASEGFSGLWSHDHDYLVKKVLRQIKPIFQDPPTELETAVQTFRHAFAVMYDSHKYVCDKFEGGQPSLLMGEDAQKTATEMIDTFKRNRLVNLGVPMPDN